MQTALKQLRELANEYNRKRYPNMPVHALPVPNYKDNTANGLTKCIIDWLQFNGYQAERISSMGRVIDTRKMVKDVIGQTRMIGSSKYIPGTGTRGTADISAIINGKSYKIEVKIGADRQSEYQKQYQKDVQSAGGIYIIATSFDQFIKAFNP